MTASIQVFLWTDSAMRRELWRTVLSNETQYCVADFADLTQVPVDVVITDQQMDDVSLSRLARPRQDQGESASFDGGVIKVGATDADQSASVSPQDPVVGPSSVSLPADATARELKLAVLLLTQIVRLGREHRAHHQLSDEYQQQALQDPLTAMPNRRAWDLELAKRWENRFSAEGPLCLAMLDVDKLKQVNDVLGHAEGDAVLRATAAALVASVRDQDFTARLGGDEFGVLLEDIDPASAQRIVDRIRCSTSRYLATGEASIDELPVTTSAGYACQQADDSVDSIYRRADQALCASKQAGGNATTSEEQE